jgi:hypothetical protein
MKENFKQFDTDEERNRWATWAREWLADENKKFGESLQRLLTYVLLGNTAGFVTLVRMVEKGSLALPLKLGACSFSLGVLCGILSGLFLVGSQWRCLNDYRRNIVHLYRGNLTIDQFNTPPNYFGRTIGALLIGSILAFVIGGSVFAWWLLFWGT